ncbi:MAG: D-serine ammonia-lyase [Clostridia bacterium]|nr:D-serine ammonia-lyase [Clostridia bacterium]
MNLEQLIEKDGVFAHLSRCEETVWINPGRLPAKEVLDTLSLGMADIEDAYRRMQRFGPLMCELFPELKSLEGAPESPLRRTEKLQEALEKEGVPISGSLYMKMDSHLDVAGSVKARGGFHDVMRHAEQLAIENGLLDGTGDDYRKLLSPAARTFFAGRKVQVASTGNLGMSIGLLASALGFKAVVHMSADAKQWKKDRLRNAGAEVIEYKGDYGRAITDGRAASEADPSSYFVDDENSTGLFLGYAAAAFRLREQLAQENVFPDKDHPLFLYLPCGVGGAPGGITFGVTHVFGDAAHCFFCEPTHAPCMLAGLASGLHDGISVQDIGVNGVTEADGLAVGRPSRLVGRTVGPLIDGEATVSDSHMMRDLWRLWKTEGIFIEPSSCAAVSAYEALHLSDAGKEFFERFTQEQLQGSVHILWSTGGGKVPGTIRQDYLEKAESIFEQRRKSLWKRS